MKKQWILWSVLALWPLQGQSADIAQGKAKAGVCFACHGETGQAILPQYPNLSGQSAAYLEIALKGYRDGHRTDPMMAPMAKALTDQDIANISAYFASVHVQQ